MGGCRCTFRDCNVSTWRNKYMHFFHFPIRQKERFLQWVEKAAADHLLSMPSAQQKNRVVCARHFRDECFMNYKRDRLVATAVPTLMRLSETHALDYDDVDSEGVPRLITLEKVKLPHLIPPEGFQCPLELQDDNNLSSVELLQLIQRDETIDDAKVWEQSNQELNKIEPAEEPTPKRQKLNDEPTTHNLCFDVSTNNITEDEKEEADTTAISDDMTSHPIEIYEIDVLEEAEDQLNVSDSNVVVHIPAKEYIDKEVQVTLEPKNVISREKHKIKLLRFQKVLENTQVQHKSNAIQLKECICQLEKELQSCKSQLTQKSEELETALTKNTILTEMHNALIAEHSDVSESKNNLQIKYRELLERFESLEKDHRALQQSNNTLESNNKDLEDQQQDQQKTQKQQIDTTVSTSRECLYRQETTDAEDSNASGKKITNSSTNTLPSSTKAQLFNGIKRYVCSAMVSLVRMEMFGNAERDWKPDERRIAVDLLRLGDSVYKYVTDEWRFRLPALRQVREWLSEANNMEEFEEDL